MTKDCVGCADMVLRKVRETDVIYFCDFCDKSLHWLCLQFWPKGHFFERKGNNFVAFCMKFKEMIATYFKCDINAAMICQRNT